MLVLKKLVIAGSMLKKNVEKFVIAGSMLEYGNIDPYYRYAYCSYVACTGHTVKRISHLPI